MTKVANNVVQHPRAAKAVTEKKSFPWMATILTGGLATVGAILVTRMFDKKEREETPLDRVAAHRQAILEQLRHPAAIAPQPVVIQSGGPSYETMELRQRVAAIEAALKQRNPPKKSKAEQRLENLGLDWV